MGRNLGTQAGVHLIEGVRLIRCPLNRGFTVVRKGSIPKWRGKLLKVCPKMAAESPLGGQNQDGRPSAGIRIELN